MGQPPCVNGMAPSAEVDVFDAKADAEAALAALGVRTGGLQVRAGGADYLHPGRSGQLVQGRTVLASFGEIHPKVLDDFGLRGVAVAFEIHLDDVPLPKAKGPARSLLTMSVFQPVTRDFAFIVDAETAAGDLLKAVRSGAGPMLSDIAVFDVYEGDKYRNWKKSVAVTITLSPTKATLTDEEIDQISVGRQAGVKELWGRVAQLAGSHHRYPSQAIWIEEIT